MTRGILAALAVAGLVGVAGCGGGDDAPRTVTAEVTRTVEADVPAAAASAPAPTPGRFDAAAIYQRDAPSVVTIKSLFGGRGGQGSGFVVSKAGEIATNAHVVTSGEGAAIQRASEVYVQFADGNQVSARVVGFDPDADVALLKIDPKGLALRPLAFADSDRVVVGAPVVAIGSPFGEESSLSVGVISATNRSIDSLTGFSISGAIQTDAAINRGNSGGPLLDARGRVLGINSQISSSSGSGSGVGFAVAGDTVQRSLDQLRRDGKASYAYLGVSTTDVYPQLGERFKLGTDHGAWVQEVRSGTPAADAGLRAGGDEVRFQADRFRPEGDVIVGVERQPVDDADDLGEALLDHRAGQTVTLAVLRDGTRREIRVRLRERPQDSGP
jgi:2-alkenal reductase